jgi:hypothetical protein
MVTAFTNDAVFSSLGQYSEKALRYVSIAVEREASPTRQLTMRIVR